MDEKMVDLLDREEVIMARQLPEERKLLIGAEFFDLVCENVKAGIRLQNPGISDNSLKEILDKRISMI